MRSTLDVAPVPQSRIQRVLTLFVLAAALLMALGTLAVALTVYRPDLGRFSFSPPERSNNDSPPANLIPPTPPCVEPVLTIGTARFTIDTVQAGADGSVDLPSDEPGIAYWITGAGAHYVFTLSPETKNIEAIASASPGDEAVIQWGDCSLEEYVIKEIKNGPADIVSLYNQVGSGFSVYVAGGPFGGLVLDSGLPEPVEEAAMVEATPEEPAAIPEETPEVAANQIQAEISFLETTEAPDGSTITMGIEVLNTGRDPITLTVDDISLTPEGRETLPLHTVEPALPVEIQPGGSQAFSLTFPKPPAGASIFLIWDFSVEFYY
jgi:hypothetical protein